MKNKKLGKILLCASLALATPFALVGCGKQAANNENDEDNGQENQQGQQQQQQQENGLAITNAKSYEGAYNTYEKNTYTDAAELKADILAMMSGDYDAPELAEDPGEEPEMPVMPNRSDFEDGSEGDAAYSIAVEQYNTDMAAYPTAVGEYWEQYTAYRIYQMYQAAMLDANYTVDQLIGNNARPADSATYTISLTEDDIEDYDENHTHVIEGSSHVPTGLAAYYQDYISAYLGKYAADNNWHEIPDTDGNAFYTTTADRDVMVSYDYDSQTSKTITIYVLAFNKDTIADAFVRMNSSVEIPHALAYTSTIDMENSILTNNTLTVDQVKDVMLNDVMKGSPITTTQMLSYLIADNAYKTDSAKYTIALPTEVASIVDYYQYVYSIQYDSDSANWTNMESVQINGQYVFRGAEGIYFNEGEERDTVVRIEKSDDDEIIVYVLSFEPGSLQTFITNLTNFMNH